METFYHQMGYEHAFCLGIKHSPSEFIIQTQNEGSSWLLYTFYRNGREEAGKYIIYLIYTLIYGPMR